MYTSHKQMVTFTRSIPHLHILPTVIENILKNFKIASVLYIQVQSFSFGIILETIQCNNYIHSIYIGFGTVN